MTTFSEWFRFVVMPAMGAVAFVFLVRELVRLAQETRDDAR